MTARAAFRPALALGMTAGLLALTACSEEAEADPDATGAEACPDTLNFSDTGVEGLETLRIEFEDFRVALEDAIGKDIEFHPISSRTAAATALEFDEIDLLLTGPAEYVVLKQEADALPVTGITREDYKAAIFAIEGSGIDSVDDLEGETVITKEVGSTSGHLGPLEMLESAGLTVGEDVEVMPLADTRMAAFASGEGAALGTGYSDFEDVQEEVDEEVYIVEEGPDLPNDLFVARTGLGENCADWLEDQLIENQDVLLEAIVQTGENDKYLNSEFVDAEDSDYDPTRRAFEAAGFDDYAELPDEDEPAEGDEGDEEDEESEG